MNKPKTKENTMKAEAFVSVDIETSGPVPGIFSLLSIGACFISDPSKSIYLELCPDSLKHDPEAVAVTGLDLKELKNTGLSPKEAMLKLKKWLDQECPAEHTIVFVGLNTPFDWSFINYHFHKSIGFNPFGFTAIDIKSYYMGVSACSWKETKSSHMKIRFNTQRTPSHNALDDALFQAELFSLMLAENQNR